VKPLRFAVVGDPIAHSKSPIMHAAAFRALGLPHTYEAIQVKADDLPGVVEALRDGRFDGLNVTVPHKARVLGLVDDVSEDARSIQAANTLARVEGRVVAFNTDAPALALEVSALAGPRPWAKTKGLVLGSGGAARAAVAALRAHLGVAEVIVRARSPRDLGALLQGLDHAAAEPRTCRLEPSPESEAGTSVVIQATSAGMQGADPGEPIASAVAWGALPDDAVALDVVYAPAETPFLRAARSRGLRAENGLGMLARQGALAFEIWTGVPAHLDAMRRALGALC
jgi:shikimate dehydrogenase